MKKQVTITIGIILTVVFCLIPNKVSIRAAENYEVYKDEKQGIEYALYSDGTCCVSKGSNECIEVIIPTEIEKDGITYKVTKIGSAAFSECEGLSSVSIPEGVTSIGDGAFAYCGLASLNIPQGVTSIGDYAFYDCSSLEGDIVIPESVKVLGSGVFGHCIQIAGLSVEEKNETYCSDEYGNIYNKDKTTLISGSLFASSVCIPEGVTSIGVSAFSGCSNLESVIIPEEVKSIGDNAFFNCNNLRGVTIPKGVTSIGDSVFYNCNSLESVTIPEEVTSIGVSAFSGCSSLESVTIPEGVTSIGVSAFSGCSNLKSVTIPEGVTSIGDNAFYECNSLESVTIPEGVTSIGGSAFFGCSSLEGYIEIPKSVKSLGMAIFSGCIQLEGLSVAEGNETYSSDKYGNIYNKKKTSLLHGSPYANSVDISKGVTKIGGRAFWCCSNLESVTIPKGVTKIGARAFLNCSNLKSVTIPKGVTSIGTYAFYGCSALVSMNIPNSVTKIGYGAYVECNKVIIHVKKGSYAEKYAKKWNYTYDYGEGTSITISSQNCKIKITSSSAKNPTAAYQQLTNTEITTITIPATIQAGGITYKVTSVANGAFKGNKTLSKVIISKNITTIGKNTFKNCTALKNITVKTNNLKKVGSNALIGTNKNLAIELPSGKFSDYKTYFKGKGNNKVTYLCVNVLKCNKLKQKNLYSK